MAADWIPVREDICSAREVLAIAGRTGKSRHWVVGALVQFWGWASKESADGSFVDVDVDSLESALGLPRVFWNALIDVGWLEMRADNPNGLFIPKFERWLSNSAKARIQKTIRQSRWRCVDAHVDAHVDRQTSTTEENRREQKSIKRERGDAPPAPAKDKTKFAERIFLSDAEYKSIQALAIAEGLSPDGELTAEIEKASDWLLQKGHQWKSGAAGLRNWIRRAGAFKRRQITRQAPTRRYLPEED